MGKRNSRGGNRICLKERTAVRPLLLFPVARQRTPTSLSPTHQDPRNAPSHRSFLDARGRTDLDPLIVAEGAAHSASKAEPQPPRYTILWHSATFGDGRGPRRMTTPNPLHRLVFCHCDHGAGERAVGLSQLIQNREVIGVGDRYQVAV